MTRATAAWTNTVIEDFEAGKFLRDSKLLAQVFQNLEHLAQNHVHDGSNGGGGIIAAADPKFVWFMSPPLGGAFP